MYCVKGGATFLDKKVYVPNIPLNSPPPLHFPSIKISINLHYKHRRGSRTAVTSNMQYFVIVANGWKPLTIIKKSSILDVANTFI